jgi:RimJ/RimL family protein N-acetyltransferase
MAVPEYELTAALETERLRLRPYAAGDVEGLRALYADPGVVRYLYGEPESDEEIRKRLARKMAGTAIRSEGDVLALVAELRSTGEMVADVILHLTSCEHRLGEIGYAVLPAHAGRGYATEAARPLLAVAFDDLRLHRVIGRVEARNVASARVLEKLGLRQEAHLVENEFVKGEWQSELVYAVLDREWAASC